MENLRLSYSQARSALQLLGEARELAATPNEQEKHLAEGLMRTLGAQAVLSGRVGDPRTYDGRLYRSANFGLTDTDRRALSGPDATFGYAEDPVAAAHLGLLANWTSPEPITRVRSQLVDDARWYDSAFVSHYRKPTRLDHSVCSMRRVKRPAFAEGLVVLRQFGDKPFTQEDNDILHLVHIEWAAMTTPRPKPERFPNESGLSDREQATLAFLVEGLGYKMIADRMSVKTSTVNEYVKRIYRKLGVHTRGELQALWSRTSPRPGR